MAMDSQNNQQQYRTSVEPMSHRGGAVWLRKEDLDMLSQRFPQCATAWMLLHILAETTSAVTPRPEYAQFSESDWEQRLNVAPRTVKHLSSKWEKRGIIVRERPDQRHSRGGYKLNLENVKATPIPVPKPRAPRKCKTLHANQTAPREQAALRVIPIGVQSFALQQVNPEVQSFAPQMQTLAAQVQEQCPLGDTCPYLLRKKQKQTTTTPEVETKTEAAQVQAEMQAAVGERELVDLPTAQRVIDRSRANKADTTIAQISEMIRHKAKSLKSGKYQSAVAFLVRVVPDGFIGYVQRPEPNPGQDGPACAYCHKPIGRELCINGMHFECYTEASGQ